MSKLILSSFLPAAALVLALVSPASAITVTIGGTAVAGEGLESSVAGATTMTFDGLTTLPTGFVALGTTPTNPLVNGSSTNVYSAPTGDASTYLTTGTGVILDLNTPDVDYFGFYWGSLDTYNVFTIVDSSGTTYNFNGAQIASQFGLTANGSTSYFVNFFATPGTSFTSAGFGSANQFAFEFDNVATASPEPGSVALLAGGLLVIAGAVRRRKA